MLYGNVWNILPPHPHRRPQEGQEALRRLLHRAVLRRAPRPRALAGTRRTTGNASERGGAAASDGSDVLNLANKYMGMGQN